MNDLLNRIDIMSGFTCCSKAIWKCPNPCWNERLSNHRSQFISSEDFNDKFNFP